MTKIHDFQDEEGQALRPWKSLKKSLFYTAHNFWTDSIAWNQSDFGGSRSGDYLSKHDGKKNVCVSKISKKKWTWNNTDWHEPKSLSQMQKLRCESRSNLKFSKISC